MGLTALAAAWVMVAGWSCAKQNDSKMQESNVRLALFFIRLNL